jgi:dTDP-4-amino-4,6-dideoxygalactose transaminase
MEHASSTPTDRSSDPCGRRVRRWRLVPPAVTPVTAGDLAAGAVGQLRGRGRDRFRNAVESFLDAETAATYTSFRRTLGACLQALASAADADRDRVLVPAFCSSDFPEAIDGVGLEAVRYDVDPTSLALRLGTIESAMTPPPLAVVAVNVLGYSSPMAALAQRCERAGTFLVEALGYALGTHYESQPLGTFGDCAVLNFQQGKPIPVGGGMIVAQESTLDVGDDGRPTVGPNAGTLAGYAALSRPRPYYLYNRSKRGLARAGLTGRVSTHPESKMGVDYAPPYARMSNFQATIGNRIFDGLEDHRRKRAAGATYYREALAGEPALTHLTPVDGLSRLQHVRYPIRLRTERLRDEVKNALRDSGVQATTLYDWPRIDPDDFPGAARLQRTILTLPTHPYVDDRDRRHIVDTIRTTIDRHAPMERSGIEGDESGLETPAE